MAETNRTPHGSRSRDELGRPLPRHEPNRLVLPDFERHSPPANARLGITYFAASQYFGAHEAWETSWKQSAGTYDAEGFKGLAQLAAGYVHLQRGNPRGCRVLLDRALGRLSGYPADWQDIDLPQLIADAKLLLTAPEPEAR